MPLAAIAAGHEIRCLLGAAAAAPHARVRADPAAGASADTQALARHAAG
ncbi:MAG: hypothetical protein ACREFZ_06090 [Acetobacteraceae bacterium]